ncbi:hypothetical protein POVWA2_080630 [Plasmodium ovale wallikeri]|uniref:PIR Superfamily Protein n=1 Tax=Plasmodium ovale wallikeri TaxID=864142 RepID=A0A1A9AL21_PLAOA|nr:hypothetical protein POVWA1_079050 [Plasmodium ovale wallikeri]SBT57615.1 hypothetical protein POVWA2_080630 [Plasmodium ovale wallikeri]
MIISLLSYMPFYEQLYTPFGSWVRLPKHKEKIIWDNLYEEKQNIFPNYEYKQVNTQICEINIQQHSS